MNKNHPIRFEVTVAGIPGKGGVKGRSGPPGNQNAFKHGLASIQKRREDGVPTQQEENVRQQILEGLIADKGGDEQVSTATRILAEVIASYAAWLVVFNGAIDHVIQNNPKARQNPRGLSQLDGYKRGRPPLNENHVIMSPISAGASRVLSDDACSSTSGRNRQTCRRSPTADPFWLNAIKSI